MSGILTERLTPRAELLLSRLPENLREAVELIAEVISRKAPERLAKAEENALISSVSSNTGETDENGLQEENRGNAGGRASTADR